MTPNHILSDAAIQYTVTKYNDNFTSIYMAYIELAFVHHLNCIFVMMLNQEDSLGLLESDESDNQSVFLKQGQI